MRVAISNHCFWAVLRKHSDRAEETKDDGDNFGHHSVAEAILSSVILYKEGCLKVFHDGCLSYHS